MCDDPAGLPITEPVDDGTFPELTVAPHLSFSKDAPVPRGVEWIGNIVCRPNLGGLHHQYGRMRFTLGTAAQTDRRSHDIGCRRVVIGSDGG
jgi:hypothetical protein